MIWIGFSVFAVLVVLGILAAVTKPAEYPDMEPMVASLDLGQAELEHDSALNTAARRYESKPVMPMNRKEFNYYLTLSIITKDRIHALQGLPNGPNVRKKWRGELIAEIKNRADAHNQDVS